MTTRRFHAARVFAVMAILALTVFRGPILEADGTVPTRLSDQEFWKLIGDLSEPAGNFRSDNLLSNEIWFQRALARLTQTARANRAYLGVGPEQNFTYAATLKPAISFILDVRRGNLQLQLLYKALFELSRDRAEFVSRLFNIERPDGLNARSSATDIFSAFSKKLHSEALYISNLASIRSHLVSRHRFPLLDEDMPAIELIYRSFFTQGLEIRYSPIGSAGGTVQPTYADLMMATDELGNPRGFLATEAAFTTVKDLQTRNMIVPVVGNFGGPKAIRAVGQYLRSKGSTVSAFYLSNVEEYLFADGIWSTFCANVASLPLDDTSMFIRSVRSGGPDGLGNGFTTELRQIVNEVNNCSRTTAR